jgi:hypothetical protein
MEMAAIYFHRGAMISVLISLIIALFLHWKTGPNGRRPEAIGSFTQSTAWLISLISTVHLLANLSEPSELGAALAFIILTALYGTAVNMAVNLYRGILSWVSPSTDNHQ